MCFGLVKILHNACMIVSCLLSATFTWGLCYNRSFLCLFIYDVNNEQSKLLKVNKFIHLNFILIILLILYVQFTFIFLKFSKIFLTFWHQNFIIFGIRNSGIFLPIATKQLITLSKENTFSRPIKWK